MINLKLYLRTKGNIKEQSMTYINVFNGKIIKYSFVNSVEKSATNQEWSYSYISLFDNSIYIMLGAHNHNMPVPGYQGDFVINVDSIDDFNSLYNGLSSSQKFSIDYDRKWYPYAGGIEIAKFYDFWGNGWVIEVDSKINL